MNDLDKMARELLGGEYQKAHAADPKCNFCTETWDVALAATRAALQAAPPGWKLVPIQPTDDMLNATSWPKCAATDYAHMLAAAPEVK